MMNLRKKFLHLLARRLQRWAETLQHKLEIEESEKPSPSDESHTASVQQQSAPLVREQSEGSGSPAHWLRGASKPPEHWIERVRQARPELLADDAEDFVIAPDVKETTSDRNTEEEERNERHHSPVPQRQANVSARPKPLPLLAQQRPLESQQHDGTESQSFEARRAEMETMPTPDQEHADAASTSWQRRLDVSQPSDAVQAEAPARESASLKRKQKSTRSEVAEQPANLDEKNYQQAEVTSQTQHGAHSERGAETASVFSPAEEETGALAELAERESANRKSAPKQKRARVERAAPKITPLREPERASANAASMTPAIRPAPLMQAEQRTASESASRTAAPDTSDAWRSQPAMKPVQVAAERPAATASTERIDERAGQEPLADHWPDLPQAPEVDTVDEWLAATRETERLRRLDAEQRGV